MNSLEARKTMLSTLWAVTPLSYLFADVFVLIFSPEFYQGAAQSLSGSSGLGFAALLELQILMVVLSRRLAPRLSKWTNLVIALLGAFWVALTLRVSPPPRYALFACAR